MQPNRIAETVIEPTVGAVGFTTDGSSVIAANTERSCFIDEVGQSGAGGYTLNRGDASIFGGKLSNRHALTWHGMQLWLEKSDDSANANTAAELHALLGNLVVTLEVDGTVYNLGLAIAYMGPVATLGAMPQIRPFRVPREIPAGASVKLTFRLNKALSAGLTASKTYIVRVEIPTTKVLADGAAGKD